VVPQQIPPPTSTRPSRKAPSTPPNGSPLRRPKLGFNRVAKYYYYPGWWEGGPQLSIYVNAKKFAELPKEYQTILEGCLPLRPRRNAGPYDVRNPHALKQLIGAGTQLRPFPAT
jgi:TRAP-type mannitol/chloroaromatic compound transport system substrate-binding protein